MCGIAGKVYLDGQQPVDPKLIERMTNVIAHRGPDSDGKYVSGPVGLGHRRLSIIDLSSAGAQPMGNEDGKVQIVFNGEIYNYLELREDLLKRGHAFHSMTDTEVIIHLYEEYGPDCLKFLRGMFAFAIWDEKNKALFLARDRVGIKPLYYTNTGRAVLFGSEIKSLLVDRDVKREVNLPAIDQFLTYFYLPSNETLFKNIYKLEPGYYMFVKNGEVVRKSYWDLRYEPSDRWSNIDEAAEELSGLLRQTVKQHMISDVPVGFLASGGVDSTALLSYAVDETDKKISTFTIGFEGAHFADERQYARLASKKFGTTHHDLTISAKDFQDFLPRYVWHMEEPVCEAPAIALYYVSKLAREHVTVLLSGEGGDEAFGGYPEYRNLQILERCKSLAGPLRGAAGAVLAQAGRFSALRRAKDFAPLTNIPLADYYYSRASSPISYFNRHRGDLLTDDLVQRAGDRRLCKGFGPMFERTARTDRLSQMLYVDTKTWLPDKLLIKADKMTMANSLELRVPFLDHVVLEFAATLPSEFKVKGLQTKRVLKRAFEKLVPQEILTRKKAGFPVPFGHWLDHDLKDFTRDTLLGQTALDRGYFRKPGVEKLLNGNGDGESHSKETFSLLVLELWHREFMDTPKASAGNGK